jgi:hypothetical protein
MKPLDDKVDHSEQHFISFIELSIDDHPIRISYAIFDSKDVIVFPI